MKSITIKAAIIGAIIGGLFALFGTFGGIILIHDLQKDYLQPNQATLSIFSKDVEGFKVSKYELTNLINNAVGKEVEVYFQNIGKMPSGAINFHLVEDDNLNITSSYGYINNLDKDEPLKFETIYIRQEGCYSDDEELFDCDYSKIPEGKKMIELTFTCLACNNNQREFIMPFPLCIYDKNQSICD